MRNQTKKWHFDPVTPEIMRAIRISQFWFQQVNWQLFLYII